MWPVRPYLTPTRSASFSNHYLETGSRDIPILSDVYSRRPCELCTIDTMLVVATSSNLSPSPQRWDIKLFSNRSFTFHNCGSPARCMRTATENVIKGKFSFRRATRLKKGPSVPEIEEGAVGKYWVPA